MMRLKNTIIFLILTIVLVFIYVKNWLNLPYNIRPVTGYILLAGYLIGAGINLRILIGKDKKASKHFYLRFIVVMLFTFITLTLSFMSRNGPDKLGAGYLLYFTMLLLGSPLLIYAIIESLWLYIKKMKKEVLINLIILEGILCFLFLSGLFGF